MDACNDLLTVDDLNQITLKYLETFTSVSVVFITKFLKFGN